MVRQATEFIGKIKLTKPAKGTAKGSIRGKVFKAHPIQIKVISARRNKGGDIVYANKEQHAT